MDSGNLENLLISKYIYELSNQHSVRQTKQRSPYELPLSHTNIVSNQYELASKLAKKSSDNRSSRSLSGRIGSVSRKSAHKRSFSTDRPNKVSNNDLNVIELDKSEKQDDGIHASVQNNLVQKRRISSASASSRNSYIGNNNGLKHNSTEEFITHKPPRKKVPSYMRIADPFVVTAYKNGTHENGVRVSAPNLIKLLEFCTTRLNLSNAAKRIFLRDGTEVSQDMSLPRGIEVFISCSESFKDPNIDAKNRLLLKSQLSWSINGICLPEEKPKDATKPKTLPERLDSKVSKRRLLVYLNGNGHDGVEFICDLDDITDLLSNCTQKFNLGQQYKKLFLWNGQEITNLHLVPEIHPLLNNSVGTPLLGPVWVTKGEQISPYGVEMYLTEVIKFVKNKLKHSEAYLEQLNYAQKVIIENDQEAKKHIYDQRVLSISDEDIYEFIDKEETQVDLYKKFLKKHRSMKNSLEKKVLDEREYGSQFTMKHISAIPDNHTLLGKSGLRLKVYENGTNDEYNIVFFNLREASRGLRSNQENYIFQRLLDTISENMHVASHNSQSRGLLVKRLFSAFGKEITSIKQLSYDDEVWVSHGEVWKDPNSYCMQVIFDKVVQEKYRNGSSFIIREDLSTCMLPGMEKPSNWNFMQGISENIESRDQPEKHTEPEKEAESSESKADSYEDDFDDSDTDDNQKNNKRKKKLLKKQKEKHEEEEEEVKIPSGAISNDMLFLEYSKKDSICVFPEVVVGIKKPAVVVKNDKVKKTMTKEDNHALWPRGSVSQIWMVHKSGHISLKVMPKLVLSVSNHKVEVKIKNQEVSGWMVQFDEKKDYSAPHQQWVFNPDGMIYSKSEPSFVLTYFGGYYEDVESLKKNDSEDAVKTPGLRTMLGIAAPLEHGKKYQRFALKQEKFENFGQWRLSKVKNPEWNKRAYSWPIKDNGEWVEEFDWPMETYLMPCAPPLHLDKKGDVPVPKRLFCMKNGARDETSGVLVTGPDLTNLKKDKSIKKKKMNDSVHSDSDSVTADDNFLHVEHCNNWTIQKLEFHLFLERCTALLGMNIAARRLYDKNGIEIFSLKDLERDQLVYVSNGEMWIDPKMTKAQLEERALLVKLSEDVSKIKAFVNLRNCDNLIITAQDCAAGAMLGVTENVLTKKQKRQKKFKDITSPPDVNFDSSGNSEEEDVTMGLTAHQIACHRSDERLANKLNWKWEKIVNDDLDDINKAKMDNSYQEEMRQRQEFSNISARQKANFLKQFTYLSDEHCIVLTLSPLFALTVASGETTPLAVTLEKRRPDLAVNQKWVFNPNQGLVTLKYRPQLALTVQMPRVNSFDTEQDVNYNCAQLIVVPIKANQFGRANQIFRIDEEMGHLVAFASNSLDKAITAANASGCCTYTISPNESLDQPGYIVFLPTENKMKQFEICVSCAKALRGKYKLQKLQSFGKSVFVCAFGTAKQSKIKEKGSFQLLNDKIDLGDGEANATLTRWQKEILAIRENLAVKSVSNRLNAARTPRPLKLLAYRNGEGRLSKPVPIMSSSILGIMEQSTHHLGFSAPVRKIFLEDGTPVYDIDDLRRWCIEHKSQVNKRQKQIQEGRLQPEVDKIKEDIEMGKYVKSDDDDNDDDDNSSKHDDIKPTDDLVARLHNDYFVIGNKFINPSYYSLSISLISIQFMEHVCVPEILDDSTSQFMLRYNIFDQTIDTDLFSNEDDFSGEKRDIMIKSELHLLKQFFSLKFKSLEVYLLLKKEDKMYKLATCYVPLDGLIRDEQEELVHSAEIGADYGWYRHTDKTAKERTRASLYVKTEISLALYEGDLSSDQGETNSSPQNDEVPSDVNITDEAVTNGNGEEQKDITIDSNLTDIVIEIWASAGEAFVPLKTAHSRFRSSIKDRKILTETALEKDIDKHIVRMMQGRRYHDQEPAQLRPTANPDNPVVVEGGWQTPRNEEIMIQHEIHSLEEKESKIRSSRSTNRKLDSNIDFTRTLYKQSSITRVNVFANGDDCLNAVAIWGETIQQILANATLKLGLRKPGKMLFDMLGKQVQEFDDLQNEQIVCVSTGEGYLRPKTVKQNVEIKANWGRARKKYGAKATDFHVQARSHPIVEVDPFGPPVYAGQSGSARSAQPTFDSKRVLVYENGRHKDTPTSVWGSSLDELLKNATKRIPLRSPAVCFFSEKGQRIVNFDEISRDDLLAVSTTGKTFLKDKA